MNHQNLPIYKILDRIHEVYSKKNIKSIILLGSAARSELTYDKDENGYIVSDIEICVFFKSFFTALKNRSKIYLKKGSYKIEILFTHKIFLKFHKTPLVYDLKTTGKILWGKDIRHSIWIKDRKKIPYWEGIRLLYNRLIPFIVLIWKHINKFPIKKSEEYNVTKLLIAIGEYLMIKNQNYHSSYKDKLQYVKEKFNENNKISLIIDALEYKLNIKPEFNNLQSIKPTCILIYSILKKVTPTLENYKHPLSAKIIEIIKNIQNRNFLETFSNFRIIPIYKLAFQLLETYFISPQKFITEEKKIKFLYTEWKNAMQIQSSYI